MEFLALIHSDREYFASLSESDQQAVFQRYMEFSQRDEVVGGAQLEATSTATTVRVREGDRLVTDGPYAEVKEALGGLFILECSSIDEACRLAAELPAAERGAVEVRPIYVREES
jgi:hypothetical protein